MSNTEKRELVHTLADACVAKAIEFNLVQKADQFKKYFEVRFARPGSGNCWARCERKNAAHHYTPIISIAIHPMYFDKRVWVPKQADSPMPRQRNWAEAVKAPRKGQWMYPEYISFHDDPVIGKFISDDFLDHLRAVIAHETAHAVAEWNARMQCVHIMPHGTEFKNAYHVLRREWVNPHITNTQRTGP